jgi:hypothetical protein
MKAQKYKQHMSKIIWILLLLIYNQGSLACDSANANIASTLGTVIVPLEVPLLEYDCFHHQCVGIVYIKDYSDSTKGKCVAREVHCCEYKTPKECK